MPPGPIHFVIRYVKSKKWVFGAALAVAVWFNCIGQLFLGNGKLDLEGEIIGRDFVQFYTAGYLAGQGNFNQLYDWDIHHHLHETFIGLELPRQYNFPAPPLFAYLFTPFSFLPYLPAFIIWSVLSILILALSIFVLKPSHFYKTFFFAISWMPTAVCLEYGQNSFLSLMIICATYSIWNKKKYFFSGLVLSLLFYKIYFAVGILLFWLLDFKSSWKAIGGWIFGNLFILLATFIFMPGAFSEFTKFLSHHEVIRSNFLGYLSSMEHGIGNFFFGLFPKNNYMVQILTWLFRLIGVFSYIFLWRKAHYKSWLCFSFAVVLSIWLSPHTMIYDWMLLIAPAILLWNNRENFENLLPASYIILWLAAMINMYLTAYQMMHFLFALNIGILSFMLIVCRLYLKALKIKD